MSLKKKEKPDFRWAVVLTALWLSVGFVCVFAQPPAKGISTLSLNEIGDLLAGFFSPLAFLWLVVGYKQQQFEIGQNTEQLKLQAEELSSLVEVEQENLSIRRQQEKHEELERVIQLGPRLSGVVCMVSNRGTSVRYIVEGMYHGPTLRYEVVLRSIENIGYHSPSYAVSIRSSVMLKNDKKFRVDLEIKQDELENSFTQQGYLEFSYSGEKLSAHKLHTQLEFYKSGADEFVSLDEWGCRGIELHWCD